jgi:hypothetical protein
MTNAFTTPVSSAPGVVGPDESRLGGQVSVSAAKASTIDGQSGNVVATIVVDARRYRFILSHPPMTPRAFFDAFLPSLPPSTGRAARF